jgi:hypothetical protein
MEEAYMRASGGGRLPATARQIFYAARPAIMAATEDKELAYKYFSQTLLPDYIEEHGVSWNVVYDARGHFVEPHTNRSIGCGTLEVDNYLRAVRAPKIVSAAFGDARVEIIGPKDAIAGILFNEKEGFNPLFRAVDLANRHDLMIVSSKGVSVTAARRLIDRVCGRYGLPLFVLHDFDVAGFLILGTLQRDTRRYQFSGAVEVVDLGLRLEDIEDLEREPAAATKTDPNILLQQLAENGATAEEIDILIDERVELNALTSDAFIEMIETKVEAYGLKKAVPDDDLLAEAYRAFHRSERLREKFEEMEEKFDAEAEEVAVPVDLRAQVEAVLAEHQNFRWDDAVQTVLDDTLVERIEEKKREAKEKTGDFSEDDEEA